MTLVAETVQINGQDVELYRITGHPVEDLVVLTNTLSELDKQRLLKAASGELKANDNTKLGEDELTGVALTLLQAVFPDVNQGPFQLYGTLFQSLAKVTEIAIKGYTSSNLVQVVYDLSQGTTGEPVSGDVEISGDPDNRLESRADGLYVRDRLDPAPVEQYLLTRGE